MDKTFSWLYTQFVCENIFINIIIHETDMFGLCKNEYTSLTYCTNTGKKGHIKSENLNKSIFTKISNKHLLVKYHDKLIDINGIVEYDDTLSFHNNIFVEKSGKKSIWDVEIPHGNFHGKIKYMSKTLTTQAYVYQDKQYGSLPIQDFLNRWGWSVTVNNNKTDGIFSISSKDNKSITIKFSCDGEKLIKRKTSSFEKSWVDNLSKLPNKSYINSQFKNPEIDNKPIRKRINENHDDFNMTYYRYICKYGSSICGVCEYMKIH